MKKHKRHIGYAILLLIGILLTIWANYEPPYLAELKVMKSLNTGTDEPLTLVKSALNAIKNNDRDQLFDMMLVKDSVDFQRYTERFFSEAELFPAKTVGCKKLVHCNRVDNVSVYVYSQPRKTTYQFALLKDNQGAYKIRSISQSQMIK